MAKRKRKRRPEMNAVREPVVAGQFYPGAKASLERALSGLTEKKAKREKIIGAISPHAGYVYSGAVAGRVLSMLAPKELFIIIGPNHTGIGKPFSVFAEGAWNTPLGSVEVDKEFAEHLIGNSGLFKADRSAHAHEHSIEVQIPFLQYTMGKFKILPLCVASLNINELKQAGAEIAKAVKELKRDAAIIASSDMTHYESHEEARKKDMQAISAILDMKEEELLKKVSSLKISMCGAAPVIITLSASKAMGAKEAKLVDYKTSGDTSGDYSSVVGYGGVIIK